MTKNRKHIVQSRDQFDRILEICKSFSSKIFDESGNLPYCGRKPKCSDLEIIALSLFQEFLSMDSEYRFFNSLHSLLPCFIPKIGTRRNFNARKHHLAPCIELIRKRLADVMSSSDYENIMLIDYMLKKIYRYSSIIGYRILKDNEQQAPMFGFVPINNKNILVINYIVFVLQMESSNDMT